MYNCISYDEYSEQPSYSHRYVTSVGVTPMCTATNKFIYVKQQFTHQKLEPVKVLVNPNFNKKVFVNPNFNRTIKDIPPIPKIHVNPSAQNLKLVTDLKDCKNISKIHVNPNILRNVPLSAKNTIIENNSKNITKSYKEPMNHTVISTRTKLVRSGAKNSSENRIKKRRSSIKSQFKIIKSSLLGKSIGSDNRLKSKYKLAKASPYSAHYSKDSKPMINKFKLDNRHIRTVNMCPKNKKYVYVNRFLSISDIARNSLLKQNKNKSVINIGEAIYKKSTNSLRKGSNPYKKTNNPNKIQGNTICKSKYKFMKKTPSNCVGHNQSIKQLKIPRIKRNSLKNVSKLKICNIPCPYYRKFGRCKGKENGKCCRKHDPDQIALCTKFLQGACIDKKCLLSHNVSPEKMPTCKFYLEGSCSRDDCPYLHVRISPKADICKDFLEGFCKKAAECHKRHQFLCPDYEKNGNCLKQRCSYPHGKMVRKYSEFNKVKFAKKSSTDQKNTIKKNCNKLTHKIKCKKAETVVSETSEVNVKSRYYIGQNDLDAEEICSTNQKNCVDCVNDQEGAIKSRPKLGRLPSYISFETESV